MNVFHRDVSGDASTEVIHLQCLVYTCHLLSTLKVHLVKYFNIQIKKWFTSKLTLTRINTNSNKYSTICYWQEVSTQYYCTKYRLLISTWYLLYKIVLKTTLMSSTTNCYNIQYNNKFLFALSPTHLYYINIRLLTMIHIFPSMDI